LNKSDIINLTDKNIIETEIKTRLETIDINKNIIKTEQITNYLSKNISKSTSMSTENN